MTEETMQPIARRSNVDLTAEYLTSRKLIVGGKYTAEDKRKHQDLVFKYGRQLAQIETIAKMLRPNWDEDLKSGTLQPDEIYSWWEQAAQQLDNPEVRE